MGVVVAAAAAAAYLGFLVALVSNACALVYQTGVF